MRVRVRYFAAMRERLGRERDEVEVPAGATAADLLDTLAARHAGSAGLLRRSRVAQANEFLAPASPVAAGAEADVIPPVSGG